MTIAAVIACVGGFCAYQYLNHEEDAESGTKKKPELPSYYAVSLLDGTAVPAMQDGVNPMSCEFKKPEPPKPPPPKPWQLPTPVKPTPPKPTPEPVKPTPTPVKPEPVKPTPVKPEPVKPTPAKPEPVKPTPPPVKPEPEKPTPPTPVKPAPPKPVPPKPPRVVELRYIGNMSIDGGNAAAQLYVSEVISKKQKNTFKARLRVGEKILGGLLEIKAFDKNRVVLVHSGNKEVKVPIRQKKPMVVSIPQ